MNDADLADINKRIDAIGLRRARSTARRLADSRRRDTTGEVAKYMLQFARPEDFIGARRVVMRRAQRAATAAARGSKPAARAQAIYDRQLEPVLPKGKSRGRNNLRPGPRNTSGPPPKRKPRRKR